jgi:hypothetical protein
VRTILIELFSWLLAFVLAVAFWLAGFIAYVAFFTWLDDSVTMEFPRFFK